MKLKKLAGATSEIWQIFVRDSSSTTGAGLTGLVFNTASLTAYYHRDTDTTATAISLVTMTVGTFTSSGFKEIDATNMPGWYQFCPPNAAIASGAKSCAIHLKGATNMAPLPIEVQLVSYNPDDTVRLGLTALPNVASGSAGAIPTTGTGANQISVSSGQVILQSGTGTGQLSFSSGILKVDVDTIKTNPVVNAGTFTFPANATGASTTNITAGTITTVTTVTAVTGLTAANLDAAITSRMATYSQPTGFLTANFTTGIPITSNIKKNQALAGFEFLMTDSTNHAPAAGLTVAVTRSIDGGAFAAGALSAVTEVSDGVYSVDFAAGDLNGKVITLKATATAADTTFERIVTQV